MKKTEKKETKRQKTEAEETQVTTAWVMCCISAKLADLQWFKVDLETDQIQSELIIWWLKQCMMFKKKKEEI